MATNKTYSINLEDYRIKGSKVFTGRDRGEIVRKDSKIDEIELVNDKIQLVIPTDIYSINPSFLEEFLVNVVSKLKKNFYNKFEIVNEGNYKINKDLEEAIERILREENALV